MNQLKDEELVVVISICNMILTQILLFDLLHSEMNIVVGKEFSCKLLYLYYSEVKFARFLVLLYVFFFKRQMPVCLILSTPWTYLINITVF